MLFYDILLIVGGIYDMSGGSYNYGGIAGLRYFARYTGAGRNYMGFRIVLGTI